MSTASCQQVFATLHTVEASEVLESISVEETERLWHCGKWAFPHGLKPGDILFTMDVSALYSSIPVEEGIHYAMDLLESHEEEVNMFGLYIQDVRELLQFI